MTTRTNPARPYDPYIAVTPDEIIFVEARPPVSADEIAYYAKDGSPVFRLSSWWGIPIGIILALALWGAAVAAFCLTKQ
jgi:hypothetical protein